LVPLSMLDSSTGQSEKDKTMNGMGAIPVEVAKEIIWPKGYS